MAVMSARWVEALGSHACDARDCGWAGKIVFPAVTNSAMSLQSEIFHYGELAVQRCAGVDAVAAKLGPRVVQQRMDRHFADFLAEQRLVIVASSTRSGRTWASALMGPPGFAHARSTDFVLVRTEISDDDPLATVLERGEAAVGLLALEAISRARIRINGVGRRTPDGLEIAVREVFGRVRRLAPADS